MATEAELTASAVAHAKKTTKSWEWFLAEIRRNPAYNYKATEWFKAGYDLELIARPVATPAPPVPEPLPPGSNPATKIIFCAQDPRIVIGQAPTSYKIALSADKGSHNPAWISQAIVDDLRKAGFKTIYSWCDCRPDGEGTPARYAVSAMTKYGLDGWVGQGETVGEMDDAIGAGARMVVGNLSALRSDQKARISNTGPIYFLAEDYWNVMPWTVPNWENLPVTASTVGIYDATNENPPHSRRLPLSDYIDAGRFPPGSGIYYAEGMLPSDWATLRAHG